MRISNSTVRHSSTKFFGRAEIFVEKFPCDIIETRDRPPVKWRECNCNANDADLFVLSCESCVAKFFSRRILRQASCKNGRGGRIEPRLLLSGCRSFILIVYPRTIERIRSSYFSCPNVRSNLTGAGEARSMDFARA